MFGRAYVNNLLHVHQLFSAYFHKLSIIAYNLYENNLTFFLSFVIQISLYISTYMISVYAVSTSEAVWESIWKQLMACSTTIFSLFS